MYCMSGANHSKGAPESDLFLAWQATRDPEAGAAIIHTYGRLAFSPASKYAAPLATEWGGTIDSEDLAHQGLVSVLVHAETFRAEQNGASFYNYAKQGVFHVVGNHAIQYSGAVYVRQLGVPKIRTLEQTTASNGPPLSNTELAKLLDINEKGPAIVRNENDPWAVPGLRMTAAVRQAVPLSYISETEPAVLDTAVPIGESPAPDSFEGTENTLCVQQLMRAVLTPKNNDPNTVIRYARYRSIIELRYGLRDGEPRSPTEVAAIMGSTRQNIAQIEHRLLGIMRQAAEQDDVAD